MDFWRSIRSVLVFVAITACAAQDVPTQSPEPALRVEVDDSTIPEQLCFHSKERPSFSFANRVTTADSLIADQPALRASSEIVEQVLSLVALSRPIEVVSVEDDVFACTRLSADNRRVIFVNERELDAYSSGRDWTKFFILAHEVGHQVNSHPLEFEATQFWQREYEADFFAGRMMRLAGADYSDLTQIFEECLDNVEFATHPPCVDRKSTSMLAFAGLAYEKISADALLDEVVTTSGATLFEISNGLSRWPEVQSQVPLPKDGEYDVVLQPAHFSGIDNFGDRGRYVNERAYVSVLSDKIRLELRTKGINALLIDPNSQKFRSISGTFDASFFVGVHADSVRGGCTSAPAIRLHAPSSTISEAIELIQPLANLFGIDEATFQRDRIVLNPSPIPHSSKFNVKSGAFTMDVGDIGCPRDEELLLFEIDELAIEISKALIGKVTDEEVLELPVSSQGPFQPDYYLYACTPSFSNRPETNRDGRILNYSPLVVAAEVVVLAAAPVNNACLASGFGPRYGAVHKGIDLKSNPAGAVYSAAPGRVLEVSVQSGFGLQVLISHGSGVYTRYAHLERLVGELKAGDLIGFGVPIGIMGQTGNATAIHLHYEVLLGDYNTPRKSWGLNAANPLELPAWEALTDLE